MGRWSLSSLSSPSPRSSWSLLLITFQNIPLPTTVLPLQFAKSAIVWNPVIYLVMNPMVVIIVIIIALHRVVIIVIIVIVNVIVINCIILNISINISSGAHSWRVYPNDLFQTQWEVRWIRLTWRWKSLYCLFVSMFNNINENVDSMHIVHCTSNEAEDSWCFFLCEKSRKGMQYICSDEEMPNDTFQLKPSSSSYQVNIDSIAYLFRQKKHM